MGGPVRIEVDRGVAVVTLDRPAELNVFSAAMGAELSAAYARFDADDAVRAIVLTGAGRAFCAGADLRGKSFGQTAETFTASPVRPTAFEIRKPVIAAVNGHAIGIGLTLALQCDIRYVALEAKLAIPQVRRGVLPDAHSHWTLPRTVSRAVAADLLLTGRTFLGAEAVQLGVAARALPAEEVLPAALVTARDIAENTHPVSVAMSKRLLWSDHDADTVERLETAYHRLLLDSPDPREGGAAWLEKRTPDWKLTVSETWNAVEEI